MRFRVLLCCVASMSRSIFGRLIQSPDYPLCIFHKKSVKLCCLGFPIRVELVGCWGFFIVLPYFFFSNSNRKSIFRLLKHSNYRMLILVFFFFCGKKLNYTKFLWCNKVYLWNIREFPSNAHYIIQALSSFLHTIFSHFLFSPSFFRRSLELQSLSTSS